MVTYVLECHARLGSSELLVIFYIDWGRIHHLSCWLLPGDTPVIGVGRCYHV